MRVHRARLLAGFLVLASGIGLGIGLNAYLRAGATLDRGGNVFILGRLAGTGILAKTLDANCADHAWKLCAYRAELEPGQHNEWWFLWDPDSPLAVLGWGEGKEYAEIIQSSIRCCLLDLIGSGLNASWKQFWFVRSSGFANQLAQDTNAVQAMRALYPREFAVFQTSLQQRQLPIPARLIDLDAVGELTVWLVVGVSLWIVAILRRDTRSSFCWFMLFCFIVENALLTGALSGVVPRYQSRIIWLLAFLALLSGVALLQSARQRGIWNAARAPEI